MVEPEPEPEAPQVSVFERIRKGLGKTRANLTGGFADLFSIGKKVDEDLLEEIETTRSGQTAKDRTRLIRTAWLRTVGRPPAVAEISRAQQHLATAESVTEGISDLLWALINMKEFVLNH